MRTDDLCPCGVKYSANNRRVGQTEEETNLFQHLQGTRLLWILNCRITGCFFHVRRKILIILYFGKHHTGKITAACCALKEGKNPPTSVTYPVVSAAPQHLGLLWVLIKSVGGKCM